MSLQTYTTTIKGRAVVLKMKKDLAKRVCSEIETALKVPGHWVEITGILGGEERRSQLWTPFGGAPVTVADPEAYAKDCEALLASLPELIDESNVVEVVNSARAVFKKHLPEDDQRETPEAHSARLAEQNAKAETYTNERNAERAAFIAKYGDGPEPVKVPEGYTAITIELNYDDSDSMSDYFDRHHGHGPTYLLELVQGRPQMREHLFRDIVAKFPDLARLSWTWNKENYSMGHGNWLESEVVGEAEGVTTYGGRNDPAVWWEVSTGYGKEFIPFRGYGTAHAPRPAPVTESAPASGDCDYTVSYERDWTWIKFPCKPEPKVLDALRSHAHWGSKRAAWYVSRHVDEAEIARWFGKAPEPKDPEGDLIPPMPEPPSAKDIFPDAMTAEEIAPVVRPSRFALGDD